MKRIPRSFQCDRRQFLQGLSAASVAMVLPRRVFGANDRIGIASIGLNGIGSMHLSQFKEMADVEIVALCDVDKSVREKAAATLDTRPSLHSDFREVLELEEVDAVIAAVPDHWHAPIALAAFEAGKDAYVEKPLAHNIREGRLIVDSAKKHGRIMQTGLQQRSGPHWQHAVERIRSGELGDVHSVHLWNAWNLKEMRGEMGKPGDAPAPEGVDYDLWLGPAPLRPFNPAHFHMYWYFFWDYSGGMVSGWGVHLFDIVMWAMGPSIESASTVGGHFVLDDLRDTPDTTDTVFQCPDYSLSYSVRHGSGWREHGDMDHGIEFIGTEGTLQINRQRFHIFRESERSSRDPVFTEFRTEGDRSFLNDYWLHKRNFLDCMRSREQPAAPPEVGHAASLPGHLANIAYRVGRSVRWDSEHETIPGDEEAQKLLTREYREPWVL